MINHWRERDTFVNAADDTASMLFDPEPNQWGLRGDPSLWREMRQEVAGRPIPQSAECLTRIIEALYVELTGRPLSQTEPFHVPRLDHGGMSGGMVSPSFWRERALPLLHQRLENHRANGHVHFMPSLERSRSTMLVDAIWRVALRLGFRLARTWWRLRRPRHQGALVAIYVGQALLLVKSSYRAEWGLPGGSMRPGEAPYAAAQREMEEEIGLPPYPLVPAGTACGLWDGRRDQVHFFELHLDSLPALRLDHREIVAARLASPDELPGIAVTSAVAAYLGGNLAGNLGNESTRTR